MIHTDEERLTELSARITADLINGWWNGYKVGGSTTVDQISARLGAVFGDLLPVVTATIRECHRTESAGRPPKTARP